MALSEQRKKELDAFMQQRGMQKIMEKKPEGQTGIRGLLTGALKRFGGDARFSAETVSKAEPAARFAPGILGTIGRGATAATRGISDLFKTQEEKRGLEEGELTTPQGRTEEMGALGFDIGSIIIPTGAAAGKYAKLGSRSKKLVSRLKFKDKKLLDRAAEFLSSDPSEQVATILKETPTKKLDEFVDVYEKFKRDPRAITGFDVVGDRMADAARQLKRQLSSIGSQKQQIIEKAKTGLVEFKDAPRRAILEINRLDDTPLTRDVIDRLQNVRTKLDLDKAIDDIQDKIFTAGADRTLPEGSRLERQLRTIIRQLNNELKDNLPASYRRLNDKYSEMVDSLGTLNRALGQEVEGVPVRGASLVKQFFSPSSRRTKELFQFIKKNTGIDLSQDTVLAKFIGEVYEDPNVRSLLSGIPRDRSGILERAVEFGVEKTGLGSGARDVLRRGSIDRARRITR